MQGIGTVEDSDMSISELAQRGRVIDSETGETLDWSANDKGGIMGFFRTPLVLAQWDEDGTHEDFETGRIVQHKAGDYKYNADGELCFETLGQRDASRKHFLSAWDTITTDGTLWNKFDPFDSDGKDKSILSTVARTALKMAPLVIGSMTGPIGISVANAYAGATAL
jgi:hypothetical protein